MSGYAERIAELAHRVTGIDLKLASISEERKANAVEASQNGKTALQKMAALDAETDQLVRSKSTLTSAADQLDAQLKEQEIAAAATARAEREAEAKRLGQALAALHVELDTMMGQLRECWERRTSLIDQLRRVGGAVPPALLTKEPGTSAARHAGLAKWISIEPVPINNVRPLASANLPH